MTETHRYERAVTVSFGGAEISIAPLKGLERIRTFESALVEEITGLAARVEQHARTGAKVSAEALLETGVDEARLLRLGLPELITEALLEESTVKERQGALSDILYANNLGRFAGFLALEALVDLSVRMNQQLPEFPTPESSGNSSEPVLPGVTSSAN